MPDSTSSQSVRGITCPVCSTRRGLKVSSHSRPRRGLRVRYIDCACGTRFTTHEVVGHIVRRRTSEPADAPADAPPEK